MQHRVDEFTREALTVHTAHSIDTDDVVATIERLVAQRGAPAHLRMDNGPKLVSAALRDWCRIWGTHTAYIEPGSPRETPVVESFNGRLRDECLNTEDFANIIDARAILEDWRNEYNTHRPHRSLNQRPPTSTKPPNANGQQQLRVVGTTRCGGLTNECRRAAWPATTPFRAPTGRTVPNGLAREATGSPAYES